MNLGALAANIVSLQDKQIKPTKVKDADTKPSPKRDKNYAIVPWRAVLDNDMNKTASMIVLIVICGYTNRNGETWVSQESIAGILNVSQQAVSKHIKTLVERGYIEILKKGHRERSARMRVVFNPTMSLGDVKAAIPARLQDDRRPGEAEKVLTKEENAARLAALKANLAKARAAKAEKHSTTSEVVPSCDQHTTTEVVLSQNMAQPGSDLAQPPEVVQSTTSRGCENEGLRYTEGRGIEGGCIEEKSNEKKHRTVERSRGDRKGDLDANGSHSHLATLTHQWGIPDRLIRTWTGAGRTVADLVALGEIGAWEAVSGA